MTNGRQFRHYVWIVNTLRQRRELTLSELNDLWVRDEVADGNPLPRSSFNKYRDAILVHSVPVPVCNYTRKVGNGDWETMVDLFNEYFADGYLFCARWKNASDGMGEQRQWWKIESIQNGVMKWKALNQDSDGSTYTETVEMTKVE